MKRWLTPKDSPSSSPAPSQPASFNGNGSVHQQQQQQALPPPSMNREISDYERFQQQAQQQQQADVVSGEQYRYALTNFRIAHERVEDQRKQLEEQEQQVAHLRARIALLEGSNAPEVGAGKTRNTVDDFSIKNTASQLDKLINRWAADIVRAPPVPLADICHAILHDLPHALDIGQISGTSMQAQCLLRHALSETISEGIINCLIVTNSGEANIQLTRLHEHIFSRDPTVAAVWRRQTFSAAVENCTPEMASSILHEQLPELARTFAGNIPISGGISVLDSGFAFSRMLHGSTSNNTSDAFYRAFVPELGSGLDPRQIELVKRCLRSERQERDAVGSTVFPGLVKVTRELNGQQTQTVVRRAQVICECTMNGTGNV